MSDELLTQIAHRLHLDADALRDLHALLALPSGMDAAGMPAHLQSALRALHTDTFFYMQGQVDRVQTAVGTRPGDPFADVIFGYMFARVLHDLHGQLENLDLLETFETGGPGLFEEASDANAGPTCSLGPVWMDDLCIPLSASTAKEVERKAGVAFGLLLDTCAKYGTTPNLDKGKSEILFAFRGPGSRALRQRYFGEEQAHSMPVMTERGVQSISIVGSYTHLGGCAHHSGETRQEMRQRLAVGHAAFTAHRKTLLQNQCIGQHRRRELFRTLVLSKVTYGMESWTLHDKGARRYFQSAIIRMYRRLLKLPADAHRTDDEVVSEAGLPEPFTLLRIARLRYLGCLYRCQDAVPWHVFNADSPWLDQLRDDLTWLWRLLEKTTSLPDPTEHFGAWAYVLKYHRSYWRRLLQRAASLELLHCQDRVLLHKLHRDVYLHLHEQGTMAVEICRSRPDPDHEKLKFGCMCCRRKCLTRGGEGAHMFRTHGVVAEERYLFDGTSCPACLKEYHTFAKLQQHLRRADGCRQRLYGQGRHTAPAPGKGSLANEQLHCRHDGLLPVQQALGPHDDRVPLRAQDGHHLHLYELLANLFFDQHDQPHADLFVEAQTIIYSLAIGWTAVYQTVTYMRDTLEPDDADLAGLDIADWLRILDRLRDYREWPFLRDPDETALHPSEVSLDDYERWCDSMASHGAPYQRRVPRPAHGFQERVIVHAFSGRRRPGDFQWFIDDIAARRQIPNIHVVSLDLVINAQWGDISRDDTYDFWLNAIRAGQVLGFLAGPPCCTWSIARGKTDESMRERGRQGPRVVRTLAELWGFHSLSLREKRQVHDGHRLLAFSLTAMLMLYFSGGYGVVEHPDEPQDEDAASIWRLPLMRLLLSLDGFVKISLAQGLLGASSAKRTGLLTLNLESLPRCIHQGAICSALPKGHNIGLSDKGTFKTAVLKEYPPAFCRSLAEGFFASIPPLTESRQPIPAVVMDRFLSMCCSTMSGTIGPDYAGR
eukprot:s759_g9.t1